MFRFFFRAIKFSLQHFVRNIWLSLATITVVTLMLFAVNMVFFFRAMASSAIGNIEDRIDVSVYMRKDATESELQDLQKHLAGLSGVKSVEVITPDAALEQFRQRHKNDPVIVQSLQELNENPLGTSLIVKAKATEDYPAILTELESPQYSRLVEEKNFEDNATLISRVQTLSRQAEQAGLALVFIFAGVAALVVFNTMRVVIYTSREELGIMKLVGATNAFVRAPFFVEEILYGLIAAVVSMAAFYLFLQLASPYLTGFFEGADFIRYFHEHLAQLAALQAAVAAFVCVLSGSIAVGKHLKV